MNILVVEDEVDISELLVLYFQKENWKVTVADNGKDALRLWRSKKPDLILLDIGLNGMSDGLEVCSEVRKTSAIPILFLTARDSEIDKIVGLEMGADDYIVKPFSPRELVARVKAVSRRSAAETGSNGNDFGEVEEPKKVTFSDVEINFGRREVSKSGQVVELASREMILLQVLVENQGIALSRQKILDLAWGEDWVGDIRTVDVHVRQLRKKLGDGLPLETVRGYGYRLS